MTDEFYPRKFNDRGYWIDLRAGCLSMAHLLPDNHWKRAYEDLAYAADRIDAMLARSTIGVTVSDADAATLNAALQETNL